MENNAGNLKKLIDEYFELEDNNATEDQLNEIAHKIDHEVYNSELIMLLNKNGDKAEVAALLVGEEEDDESFFIPVYTSKSEADKATEFFMEQEGSGEFEFEILKGSEIIATYQEDDDFLGLAIDAPENGFVVFADTVHDCCDE